MKNKHLFTYTTDIAKYETARTKASLSGKSINFVADPKEPFIAVNPLDNFDLVKFKTLPENTVSKNQENAILVSTGNFTQWKLLKNFIIQPQVTIPKGAPAELEYIMHIGTVALEPDILQLVPPATIIVSTENPEDKGGLYYYTEYQKLKKIAFTDDITSGSDVTEQYLRDHGVLPELSADKTSILSASTLCFYNSNENFEINTKLNSLYNPCIVNHIRSGEVSLYCGLNFGIIKLATTNYVDSKVSTINASINSLKATVTATSTNVTTANSNASSALSTAKKALSTANTANTTADNNKNDITIIKDDIDVIKEDISNQGKESLSLGDALKLSYVRGNEDLFFSKSSGHSKNVFSSDLIKIPGILSYKNIIGRLKGLFYTGGVVGNTVVVPKGKAICNRNLSINDNYTVYEVISDIYWSEVTKINTPTDENTFYSSSSSKLKRVNVITTNSSTDFK